jgi:CheY-like chemotaxis protein
MRVLIVDDEASVRANLAAYLEDDGIDVLTAVSGEEALAIVDRETQVAVCVMDMRLPGMNGNETIRAIHARRPNMLFVVHTATAQYALPHDLRAIGLTAADVFHKPMPDMAPLAAHIHSLACTRCSHE